MSASFSVFKDRGWVAFEQDGRIARWVAAVRSVALELAADPEMTDAWLRCGGTWFAGVNVLENDADGALPDRDVPPISGAPFEFIAEALGFPGIPLDRAQVSICYPGYPKPWEGESAAAFRYRALRDAAHVDGLLRDEARRRRIGEAHAFILGIPLTEAHPEAAPFVVWEGSHEVIRTALRARLSGIPPERWPAEDITDAYVEARRIAFDTCPRVPVTSRPGEAYICHRLLLHGVAPWTAPEQGPETGPETGSERAIAYFRPEPPPGLAPDWWLERP